MQSVSLSFQTAFSLTDCINEICELKLTCDASIAEEMLASGLYLLLFNRFIFLSSSGNETLVSSRSLLSSGPNSSGSDSSDSA